MSNLFFRVLLLKDQRAAALTFRAEKDRNRLFSCLKEWYALVILEKDSDEKKSMQLKISLKKRRKKVIFRIWSDSLQKKLEAPVIYFKNRILLCHFHEWRLVRTARLLTERQAAVCGFLKVHQQRAFRSWVTLLKKKRAMSYAINLLQLTIDRVTARRALLRWPGWQQYRKSEAFRKNLMQRKRERCGCMLRIIDMLDKEKEIEEEEEISKGMRTDKHLKRKDSLAERVALEATTLISREGSDSSPEGSQVATLSARYTAAVAAAKCALLTRAGVHHSSHISGELGISTTSKVQSSLDFFLGSLWCSQSREEQAVKELLLLLQIVLMAWSKAARMLSGWRAKGRTLRRSVNKVALLLCILATLTCSNKFYLIFTSALLGTSTAPLGVEDLAHYAQDSVLDRAQLSRAVIDHNCPVRHGCTCVYQFHIVNCPVF